ncbi:MAG: QcrA and Rieske domain-containing protein [Deltaproteobacteria bacterium]
MKLELLPKAASSGEQVARRSFFTRLSLGVGAVMGFVLAIPTLGFVFAPLFEKQKEVWRAVGPVDRFRTGETVEVTFEDASPLPWAGITARSAAWLRREGPEQFVAMSLNCTHLGCSVRWMAGANLFMCPCHGGVYYEDGRVAAGPPPEPLHRFPVRVRDGQVEILASPIPITTTVSV